MGVQTKLIIMMVFLVVLPLCVTVVTWTGLKQMDTELRQVTEEFSEARALGRIENDMNIALAVLTASPGSGDPIALDHLRSAETALLGYLAGQHTSVASDEHQADEAEHAAALLTDLRELTGAQWSELDSDERLSRSATIVVGLERLFTDADQGVLVAPELARETRSRTLILVVMASVISALACIVVSAWSTRSVIVRLRELRRSMLNEADPEGARGPRDVNDVVDDLERLNERLLLRIEEKSRELLRRERMAGIGLLAADVAHEINNPLNAMLGLSELSLRATADGAVSDEQREELHESLTVIKREIGRCRGIVDRLMAMVRGPGETRWFDAARLLAETIDVARAARPDRARCFEMHGEERGVRVLAPHEGVRQIILTLLINAADAVPAAGRIQVDVTRADGEAWVRVRDNGRGFTPDVQARFDVPFSTTRAGEGGAGLGLSIAHAVAREIGAEIRSESDGPGRGSLFTLVIPLTEQPP